MAVLDVKMPKLDGIEAARRILDERPIPIVMLTAYGQDELVQRAAEAGVFGTSSSRSASRICCRRFAPRARGTRSSPRCARKRSPSPRRSPRARRSSVRRAC